MYKNLLKKYESDIELVDDKSISYDDAKEKLKELVLAKAQEYDTIDENMFEEIAKGAFNRGLSILGTLGILASGAHDFNKQSSQPKPKTQQQIQQEKQKIQDAYDQARREGQEIIGKYEKKSRDGKIDNFLKTIAMNESSGGKNTNHKQMKTGIHAGTSAFGTYGLMPNTIREMANRMDKYHPMKMYANMENHEMTNSLKKNPEHEGQVAKFMANHLYDKFGGDENKMAYSWFNGHNLTNDHFKTSHKDYQNHDYVKKYQKHKAGFDQPKIKDSNSVASNK